MPIEIEPVDFLVLSILVLWLGNFLTGRIRFLDSNNIPIAVTGGLIFSVGVLVFVSTTGREVAFDMNLRDLLLLIFFSTIGLTSKLKTLAAGGKTLGILLLAATVFLVLQNATGVGLAMLFGAHPAYGLFGGSVSLAGGHGTAIAWGAEAEKAGLTDAGTLGIAFATFGLIAGGLLGGPLAGRLIRRDGLAPAPGDPRDIGDPGDPEGDEVSLTKAAGSRVDMRDLLGTILMLALCVGVGDSVNRWLFSGGVVLPGFLTAMLVGIVLTNVADVSRNPLSKVAITTTGDVALHLFLSMSLMSMDLSSLSQAAKPIVVVLTFQMLVITLFSVYVVYRLMGRDYDAAVISGGFVGLGLGATPVAIANMQAVTGKFGPSARAFLVVPLVGAFFIDLVNAMVIKFFIALPFFQVPV